MAVCRSEEIGFLLIGFIFVQGAPLDEVLTSLENFLGSEIIAFSPVWEFITPKNYYYKEMGMPLFRQFYLFDKKIYPLDLVEIKLKAMELESIYSCQGRRKVNIDPGYISPNKFLLSTTKNYYHRIYLLKGIYLDLTLSYFQKRWHMFQWTYPDFERYLGWFSEIRDEIKNRIR